MESNKDGTAKPFDAAHGWAAIETAPKDGTKLLLWCGYAMEIGYWSTSLWVTRPDDSPLGKQDGAWIIYEDRSYTIEITPTHWMRLPEPPNAEVSDGGPLTHDKPAAQSRRSLH